VAQDPSQSSFGLQPNVAAGIASFFGLIGGLVILLGKPPQQWVRFVAVEAIVLFVAYIAIEIALSIISMVFAFIPGVRMIIVPLIFMLQGLVALGAIICWIIMTIKAFTGSAFRLPVLAEYADKYSAASATL
jgi:uncharacterized membrane protein